MSVQGTSNLPVAPRDTPWDAPAAKRRVLEACAGNVACISRAFLWRGEGDPRTPDVWELGFADFIGGRLHIVPKGIAACAGGRGIVASAVPDDDAEAVRLRINTIYDRVRREVSDWPASPFAVTADASGIGWEGAVALEGIETGDARFFADGAFFWEDGPWPLVFDIDEMDHTAPTIGTANTLERREGGIIWATGNLSASDNEATQQLIVRAAELIDEGAVGVSVSYDSVPEDEQMPPEEGVWSVSRARIRHVAIVDVPAFSQARVALAASVRAVRTTRPEFFTDPGFGNGSKHHQESGGDERLVWQEPEHPDEEPQFGCPLTITEDGHIFGHAALWYRCFAGETEYLTEEGVRTLKETVGTTQRVLTSQGEVGVSRPRAAREFGGVWVDAEIRAFGIQPLMKVTLQKFGQTKEIFATPDHRWLVTPKQVKPSKHDTRKIVVTKDLEAGARLAPLFPKVKVTVGKGIRPGQFGVAHGFTFGDGSRFRDGCRVKLWGAKDQALLPYFALSTPRHGEEPNGIPTVLVHNLPAFFKDLPSRGESLSYLYGWLAGYFAADGSVSTLGTPTLYSADKGHLEYVRDVCIRLGIGTSEIKTFMRSGARTSDSRGGVINDRVSALHRITFVAQTLSAEFFLLDEHRRRFESRANKNDPYTAWRVVSVESTDRIEEVYCAVVPGTENFTLLDNINVMNCHVGFQGTCVRPPKEPAAYRGYLTGERVPGVPTGPLVFRTRHAPLHLSAAEATAHYDNTGAAPADLTVGPDAYGIWVSGMVRPDATEADIEMLRASALSGDWRPVANRHRLIGVLAVSAPGFRVARAMAASGALITVGPGCDTCDDQASLEDRVTRLEELLASAQSA